MGDVLILIPQEGCLIIFRTATINIVEFCAENIICFVFEYGHGAQSRIEYTPPLQRITAYVCMMDPRCAHSFSNMHSYELTMCTAIMPETWGPCARASQCGEKSLRRDVLA
jgi:hypothetical protein